MCDVSMGSRVPAHPSSTWPPLCGCRAGHTLGDARVGRAALPACLKLFRRGVFGSGWWIPLGFVCSAARGVFAFGGGKVW
jgi:hypothetical protein